LLNLYDVLLADVQRHRRPGRDRCPLRAFGICLRRLDRRDGALDLFRIRNELHVSDAEGLASIQHMLSNFSRAIWRFRAKLLAAIIMSDPDCQGYSDLGIKAFGWKARLWVDVL
jgi:hypothetical protein